MTSKCGKSKKVAQVMKAQLSTDVLHQIECIHVLTFPAITCVLEKVIFAIK